MKQDCIIVFGMHRSGTSTLMGLLNILGVKLGPNLMNPAEDNPKGFFENNSIVQVNEKILRSLNSSWHDLFSFSGDWWNQEYLNVYKKEIIENIAKEFKKPEIFGIKDSRLCILLPFWKKIFEELNIKPHYIISVRNPLEVADSLKKRNGFSIEKSMHLWMKYMLNAEYYSRGYPRTFSRYDDLLKDAKQVIDKITYTLDIKLPRSFPEVKEEIESFIDPEMKHHNFDGKFIGNNIAPVVSVLNNLFNECSTRDSVDESITKTFDDIRMQLQKEHLNPRIKPLNLSSTIPSTDSMAADYLHAELKDVEAIIPKEALRILDVGCGEGIVGRRLLERGAGEVVGVEISPDVCERAEKNLTGVICGDIEEMDLRFSEGYFDCIILADILEHLKDPLSTLKKLRKSLSDSGVVVASIPNIRFYNIINMLVEGYRMYEDSGILDRTHLRFFTKKEMEVLFADAGFELTGITANIDPAYNSLRDPLSGEISFGRVSLRGLAPEELKDLFVFQYLLKAQKSGVEVRRLDGAVKTAIEAGNLDGAKKVLEGYLALHPVDIDVLLKHAEVCCGLGLLDKAMEDLEKILIFEPDREDALELRERILGCRMQ